MNDWIRHTELARRLGVNPVTVRRAWRRGALPGAVIHGPNVIMIPARIAEIAVACGLRRVAASVNAGTAFPSTSSEPLESAMPMLRHGEFARRLGLSPIAVRRVFQQGGLPGAVLHSPGILLVPRRYLFLAMRYGLVWLARQNLDEEKKRPRSKWTRMPGLPVYLDALEVAGSRSLRWPIRHTEMAKRLGIPAAIVRAAYERGGLPGTVKRSAHVLLVPQHFFRLSNAFGLVAVERMVRAGWF